MEDTSLEFDMFEDVRRKLVEVFERAGYTELDAEKVALYIVQGIRDVPKLIAMLGEADSHTQEEISEAINAVLLNASAMEKARAFLSGRAE